MSDKRKIIVYVGIKSDEIVNKLGNPKVLGTVFTGAVLKLFGLPLEKGKEVMGQLLKASLDINILALQEGYNSVDKLYEIQKPVMEDRILINGNQAIAVGALTEDLHFQDIQ